MLSAEKILTFVDHEDAAVRSVAITSLTRRHDPAPATVNDIWRYIDAGGSGGALADVRAARMLCDRGSIPWTDSAIARLFTELASPHAHDRRAFLLTALENIDLPILEKYRDEAIAAASADPIARDHIEKRLSLASVAPQVLWDSLDAYSASIDDKSYGEFDGRASDRLIEALAPHREFVLPRCQDLLNKYDPKRDVDSGWITVFAVTLAGQARLHELADRLSEFLDVDADAIREEASRALARMGGARIVERIESEFARETVGFKIVAGDLLGRMALAEKEATLVRLLGEERDPDVLASLANALCDCCATEGTEALYGLADGTRLHPFEVRALRGRLLALGKMIGWRPPEDRAREWERQIEEDRKSEGKLSADTRSAMLNRLMESLDQFQASWRPLDSVDADDLEPVAPIRRDSPKVGRNDPCPCGSGKKYKKCCGA